MRLSPLGSGCPKHRLTICQGPSGLAARSRTFRYAGLANPGSRERLIVSGPKTFLFLFSDSSAAAPVAPLRSFCSPADKHDSVVNPMPTPRRSIVRALSHPLRIFILGSLEDRSRTPGGLAGLLDVEMPVLAYHLKVLSDSELVRPVDKSLSSRGQELLYELVTPPLPFTKLLPPKDAQATPRGNTSGPIIQVLLEGGIAAIQAGILDTDGANHLSHISAVLDVRGWQEVATILLDAEKHISQTMAYAARRLGANTDGVQVTVVLAGVPTSPRPDEFRTSQSNGWRTDVSSDGQDSPRQKKEG